MKPVKHFRERLGLEKDPLVINEYRFIVAPAPVNYDAVVILPMRSEERFPSRLWITPLWEEDEIRIELRNVVETGIGTVIQTVHEMRVPINQSQHWFGTPERFYWLCESIIVLMWDRYYQP